MSQVYEMPLSTMTIVPGEDLTGKRYRFVTVDKSGKGIVAEAGGATVGVLQEPCSVDQPAKVMTYGISMVEIEGSLEAGALVAVGTDGKAKAAVEGAGAVGTDGEAQAAVEGAGVVGVCVVGGSDGNLGSVLLK